MSRWLPILLIACSSGERAPGASGERPSGMSAPPIVFGQGAAAPSSTTARVGVIRLLPSLMRAPAMGEAAPGDVALLHEGVAIPVRDGTFDPGGRAGWFTIQRGASRVLANIEPSFGELALPLICDGAFGMPRADRATVVLQLLDNAGAPVPGVHAGDKPGVIGPCYDRGNDDMDDKLVATGARGAVAYLEIDPRRSATFEIELTAGGRPIVAAVPIVGGTVTFLRAALR